MLGDQLADMRLDLRGEVTHLVPGWRWFLVHTAAVAVLLMAALQNVAGSQADPEGALTTVFTAPMYCLLPRPGSA